MNDSLHLNISDLASLRASQIVHSVSFVCAWQASIGYSGLQTSCVYPHIPTLQEHRLGDLWRVSCLLSPSGHAGPTSPASCAHCRPALTPRPSAPMGSLSWGQMSCDRSDFPRDQRCEIRVSVGLVPSEALRESTPGLSPACGGCHRPGLASVLTWAFPCACLSVCLWWTPLLIRTPVTGFTACPNWHDLIFTNLICQDHVSKEGHMLRFQVDVNLGTMLLTQDSASGAEGTGPRPQGRCIQGLPPA